jgi:hypothetical protein
VFGEKEREINAKLGKICTANLAAASPSVLDSKKTSSCPTHTL